MSALLETRDLTKRFGGLTASNRCVLSIDAGETHALIGPNGAGKTTLIAQLAGSLKPDAGSVHFAGADITHRAMHKRVALGLARSYQITSIFARFSVLENLALGVLGRSGSSFRFWRPLAVERSLYQEAAQFAAQIGLGARLSALAGELAHAEQRQLEVGLALVTRPKLLLLDEPLAGMGPDESQRMIELIRGLNKTVTVLLVEHDMDAVFKLADRISVMVAGRVIASGTPAQIRDNAEVRRAYLGEAEAGGGA